VGAAGAIHSLAQVAVTPDSYRLRSTPRVRRSKRPLAEVSEIS
jgi:hypothetical protein